MELTRLPAPLARLAWLDRLMWHFFVAWFAVAACLYLTESPHAGTVTAVGVALMLCDNLVRFLFLTEAARRMKRSGFALLGVVVIVMLITPLLLALVRQ